ncbi:MAG: GIY-YIG nuclease family protein [Eudoraea sp.]|nr:GIY-YIG nuclease family protein [Eudoraea sp.]
MFYVYIIRSLKDGSFYTGMTRDISTRISLHNSYILNKGITKRKIPWKYFFILETDNKRTALLSENHIKRMKSKAYIENLKKYPEIAQKLIKKYS